MDTRNLKYANYIFKGVLLFAIETKFLDILNGINILLIKKEYENDFPNKFIDDDKDYTITSAYLMYDSDQFIRKINRL